MEKPIRFCRNKNVEVIPSSSIPIQPLAVPFYPLSKDMERRNVVAPTIDSYDDLIYYALNVEMRKCAHHIHIRTKLEKFCNYLRNNG